MSSDEQRLRLDVPLPIDMDSNLRAALTDAFRKINNQVSRLSQRSKYVSADHVAGEDFILADANSAALTITLISPADWVDKEIHIKKVDATSNAVNIVTASGEVEGTATVAITTQYVSLSFMSDGKNWYIV